METKWIRTKKELGENIILIDSFFSGPWLSSFPVPIEREDPENIIGRIGEEIRGVRTEIELVIESGEVIGGLVLDRYIGTEYIEIIYLCISADFRGLGYGTRLISDLLQKEDSIIFLESEKEIDSITKRRLEWYKRLGFSILDFDYIMPPLVPGNEFYSGLHLLSSEAIDYDRLRDFMARVYYKFGVEGSKETIKSIKL